MDREGEGDGEDFELVDIILKIIISQIWNQLIEKLQLI